MSQYTPDPAAEFAVAVSIYNPLRKRRELEVSEAFQGHDQFMRACVNVGKVFEAWACTHVDFEEEVTDVWPYLLEDHFLDAYEQAHGRLEQDNLYNLERFNETSCPAVWAALRKKQL
jgi:hypothetical protein